MATLRYFLQRSAVLKLYREILRTARKAPPEMQTSICTEARNQLEQDIMNNKHASASQFDFLLFKGYEKLSQLRKLLMLSTVDTRQTTTPA